MYDMKVNTTAKFALNIPDSKSINTPLVKLYNQIQNIFSHLQI